MSSDLKCPKCERQLPDGSPEGLCPRCLLSPTISDMPDDMLFPPMDEMARFFPNLEVLEPVGHGGFGIVYKVRQPNLDRYAALKVIRPSLCDKPGFAERFKREAQALTELRHPNIVDVYDFDERDGMWYLLMEYVEGSSLRELMTADELPPRRLEIVTQVCDALQFAHDKGVVHRDIKPENILVGEDGKVKIVDFGLIKYAMDDPTQLTVAGTTMGTPYYMAPEQLADPSKVDHRADIYSLGVVIYELLTGELPVGRWDPPSHRAKVDVHLDEVVLRSLEKEPERRYQHASDLKDAVNEAGGSQTHTERPGDRGEANQKGKQLAIWGLLLQLGAVVGLVWTTISMVQAFNDFTDGETLAQEISRAVGPVAACGVLGLVGVIMVLVALFRARYRSPWFYNVLWVLSILWLVNFPIGTILGIIVIIYLVKHKDEFTEQAPAGDLPSRAPKPQATPRRWKVKVTTLVAAAALVACLVYLVVCGMFALRPISPGSTSTHAMTFTFYGSMEDALDECAADLRKKYGTSITVNVEGETLAYRISFPTPTGYDDVTDTITLSEDVRSGQGSCKLTSNLVVKERPSPLLLAPLHYLTHRAKKPQSGGIARYLKHKLSQMAATAPQD